MDLQKITEDLPPASKFLVLAFWFEDSPKRDRYSFLRDTAVCIGKLPSDPGERKEAFARFLNTNIPVEAAWLYKKDGVEVNGGDNPCLLLGWGGECFKVSF